jgi:hypothetical protein
MSRRTRSHRPRIFRHIESRIGRSPFSPCDRTPKKVELTLQYSNQQFTPPSQNPTSLAYDNTCKYLAEKFPAAFVNWLLPIDKPTTVQVLKTELIQEPIRADSLVFLQTDNQILHLEFETRPYSDPPIAFRMLDYYVRLKRQYSCSINKRSNLFAADSLRTSFCIRVHRHEHPTQL